MLFPIQEIKTYMEKNFFNKIIKQKFNKKFLEKKKYLTEKDIIKNLISKNLKRIAQKSYKREKAKSLKRKAESTIFKMNKKFA